MTKEEIINEMLENDIMTKEEIINEMLENEIEEFCSKKEMDVTKLKALLIAILSDIKEYSDINSYLNNVLATTKNARACFQARMMSYYMASYTIESQIDD